MSGAPSFWYTHVYGAVLFYVLLVLHPLPGPVDAIENPFAHNVNPKEWGVSDTWVRNASTGNVASDLACFHEWLHLSKWLAH